MGVIRRSPAFENLQLLKEDKFESLSIEADRRHGILRSDAHFFLDEAHTGVESDVEDDDALLLAGLHFGRRILVQDATDPVPIFVSSVCNRHMYQPEKGICSFLIDSKSSSPDLPAIDMDFAMQTCDCLEHGTSFQSYDYTDVLHHLCERYAGGQTDVDTVELEKLGRHLKKGMCPPEVVSSLEFEVKAVDKDALSEPELIVSNCDSSEPIKFRSPLDGTQVILPYGLHPGALWLRIKADMADAIIN